MPIIMLFVVMAICFIIRMPVSFSMLAASITYFLLAAPDKLGQVFTVIKESDYKRYFLSGVVSNYFTGSYKEMVSFFVRDRKISKKELEDLIDIIEDEES